MDELSLIFDNERHFNNRNINNKRVSTNGRKRKLSTMVSPDDGIGLSTDSFNDSIAQRIKTRNKTNDNSKQFDSRFFFDRVVDRIAHKYRNNTNDDAIIDVENLEITDKTGVMEKRVRTEFGYFAENSLEDLRKSSFRDKSLIESPIDEFITEDSDSTPKRIRHKSLEKRSSKTVSSLKQMPQKKVSNCKKDLSSYLSKCGSLSQRRQSMATTVSSKSELIAQQVTQHYESDDDLIEDLTNHPLVRYEKRSFWTDKDYQISCLRSAIQMLKTDESGVFRAQLKKRAMETLNLPVLPSGPNLQPRIIFNQKGEPNFEFHFLNPESPLDVTEELNNTNHEILDLTLIVYDLIRINFNPNNRRNPQKTINLENRRRIKY